ELHRCAGRGAGAAADRAHEVSDRRAGADGAAVDLARRRRHGIGPALCGGAVAATPWRRAAGDADPRAQATAAALKMLRRGMRAVMESNRHTQVSVASSIAGLSRRMSGRGRRLPLAIPMNERLPVAVAHSKAAGPVSA